MKRVLLWILGIVIVLGVAGAILLGRIDTQFVVNQIADATAKATGKPLVFASAPSLSLLPHRHERHGQPAQRTAQARRPACPVPRPRLASRA